MSLLIAVKSCEGDRQNGLHQAIRDTWGKEALVAGLDLFFFMGRGSKPIFSDEVLLDVADEYHELPRKSRGIFRWATNRNYGHSFMCDTDTFTVPRKLIASGFDSYDYFGVIQRELGRTFDYTAPDRNRIRWHLPKCYPWASGGVGYFISQKAMNIMAQEEPTIWAEDLWVGQVLGQKYVDGGISMADAKNLEGEAAWHFPRSQYYRMEPRPIMPEAVKQWMHQMYGEFR